MRLYDLYLIGGIQVGFTVACCGWVFFIWYLKRFRGLS